MSDVKKPKEVKEHSAQPQKGPQASAPTHCKAENCKKSHEKFGFCMEHYEWYMAGILRGDGKKPLDFDKKLMQWQQQKHRKVA